MDCPRCHPALSLQTIRVQGKTSLDFCPSCCGVWVEPEDVEALLRGQLPNGPERHPEPPLSCPQCHALMVEIQNTRPEVPTVDRCDRCGGVWFDQGEMNSLKKWLTDNPQVTFAPHDATARSEAPSIIPLRSTPPSSDAVTIDWVWTATGFVILMGALGATSLFLGVWTAADAVITSEPPPEHWLTAGTCILVSFFLGGVVTGWQSKGFTVLEAAIAAIPAALLCPLLLGDHFSTTGLLAAMGLGCVVSMLGAATGEHFSN